MSNYHRGTRRVINPDDRALLFKATGIQVFATERPEDLQAQQPSQRSSRPRKPASSQETEVPLVLNEVTLKNREELSSYLRGWLAEQPPGTTKTKLARMTKIPESTFLNYFSGHGFPGDRNRTEFVSLIEKLTPPDQKIVVKLSARDLPRKASAMPDRAESELRHLLDKVMLKFQQLTEEMHRMRIEEEEPAPMTPREHAQNVLALLYSLDRELQYFRNSSSTGRDQLRRFVNGQDVGYITSLLRALYDEDKFQSWQLFSNYQMVSKGNGGRGRVNDH
jgi:hypothetical protein